jgi:hypothetical protein
MTLAELEYAERRMQQQWRDLALAEQEGGSLEVLEQMYDSYILLLEEYNRCCEEYQRESSAKLSPGPATKRKRITQPISSQKGHGHVRLAS